MRILLLGSGGREHALAWKLAQSRKCDKLYIAPGNAGTALVGENVAINVSDFDALKAFAVDNRVDMVVVGPEDPLVKGIYDCFKEDARTSTIPVIGPSKQGAVLEGSKDFAKQLMERHDIPTAKYQTFDDLERSTAYVREHGAPIVIKADGLAAGKGVTVAMDEETAIAALEDIFVDHRFGNAGAKVVIEDFLEGQEFSLMSFVNGTDFWPMPISQDHKRAYDGDKGPNTGGMGAFTPSPNYTPEIAARCMKEIFLPTVAAMQAEGCPFKGCLYFGLMLTPDGPKVIEYNCRFGDPETQVVLPLLESDLLTIMEATTNGTLDKTEVRFRDGAAACVILASGGYPLAYEKGKEITGLDNGQLNAADVTVYHAGTAVKEGRLVTNGGRVLGVTATADTLPEALKKAYAATESIHFDKLHKRSDIGARALAAMQ